jgi:hypothetical protein
MEIIGSILIVSLAFSFVFYLYQKHLSRLEELLKARDYTEFSIAKREEKKITIPLPEEPENLQDWAVDKKPEEIRRAFR